MDASNNGTPETTSSPVIAVTASENWGSPTATKTPSTSIVVRNSTQGPYSNSKDASTKQGQ
jgi:hypothetical protein